MQLRKMPPCLRMEGEEVHLGCCEAQRLTSNSPGEGVFQGSFSEEVTLELSLAA